LFTIPDVKTYYRTIIIKPAWCWHKNSYTGQQNKTETPEINPLLYRPLISVVPKTTLEQRQPYLYTMLGKRIFICRRIKLGPYLPLYTNSTQNGLKT
jgi:hypothetical protein